MSDDPERETYYGPPFPITIMIGNNQELFLISLALELARYKYGEMETIFRGAGQIRLADAMMSMKDIAAEFISSLPIHEDLL